MGKVNWKEMRGTYMNPYIKIKESQPIYIGRLTLQTKGIGNVSFIK